MYYYKMKIPTDVEFMNINIYKDYENYMIIEDCSLIELPFAGGLINDKKPFIRTSFAENIISSDNNSFIVDKKYIFYVANILNKLYFYKNENKECNLIINNEFTIKINSNVTEHAIDRKVLLSNEENDKTFKFLNKIKRSEIGGKKWNNIEVDILNKNIKINDFPEASLAKLMLKSILS